MSDVQGFTKIFSTESLNFNVMCKDIELFDAESFKNSDIHHCTIPKVDIYMVVNSLTLMVFMTIITLYKVNTIGISHYVCLF